MKQLNGKRAVVTGAASGIGRAVAAALAREGVRLYLVDIDQQGLESLERDLAKVGGEVITQTGDAADPACVSSSVQAVESLWGGLDVLVNSTGNLYWGPTHQMSWQQCESVLAANLLAPAAFTRGFLPLLLRQPESNVVNINSSAGLFPAHRRAIYTASKFGIVGFCEALQLEYKRKGLRLTLVCPGMVAGTGLFRNVMTAPGQVFREEPGWDAGFTTADRVAEKAIEAIKLNRRLVIEPSGRSIWLLYRCSPSLFRWAYQALLRWNPKGWANRGFHSLADPGK